MGQAKKRGSFEQRQQAAYDRIDAQTALIQQAHENQMELERMDREAEAMAHTNAAQLVKAYWQFSGIERRILRSSSFIDPAVVTAFKGGTEPNLWVDGPLAAE